MLSKIQQQNKKEINTFAQQIWDFHLMNHKLKKADIILALGSNDIRVAERAADLYLEKLAPVLIFSGGLGNFTKDLWDEPEANKFAKIAIKKGVPKEKILLENKSTNTGENIQFTHELIKKNNIPSKKIIIVQKPFMERRAYATFMKQWPEKNTEIYLSSPQINFEYYPNDTITKDNLINAMVGDLERIITYPDKGYQIAQEIPDNVLEAYKKLIKAGYTKHLC